MTEKKKSKTILPKEEPLFIKFLNSKISEEYVTNLLDKLESLFNDESDKNTVKERKESFKDHHLEAFRLVQKKFKDHIDYIINFKKFDKDFGQWANFYLSSLREIKDEDKKGNIQRFVKIGDANGDWITGVILYNFSLFCRYYGTDLLKNCQQCGSYFTIKGKYAKFCSDGCKKTEKSETVDLQ